MANLTYFSANKINDYLFGGTSFTPPTNYYLGISTTPINKNGVGITEPSDTAYDRIQIANLKTKFTVSSNGVISNSEAFSFDESLVSWGVVTHWFISSAATGGDIWYAGTLTNSKTVEANTALLLPIGALKITTD